MLCTGKRTNQTLQFFIICNRMAFPKVPAPAHQGSLTHQSKNCPAALWLPLWTLSPDCWLGFASFQAAIHLHDHKQTHHPLRSFVCSAEPAKGKHPWQFFFRSPCSLRTPTHLSPAWTPAPGGQNTLTTLSSRLKPSSVSGRHASWPLHAW